MTTSQHYIRSDDGTRLFCTTISAEDPRYTVIFEPGFSKSPEKYMMPHAQEMAKRGAKCVLWTPRGVGRSEGRFDLKEYADDRANVVSEYLAEEKPVFSIAHSLGAHMGYKSEIRKPTGLVAMIALEMPEDPKTQAKAYTALNTILKHRILRAALNLNVNPVFERCRRAAGSNTEGLLYKLGNVRVDREAKIFDYNDLHLPYGETADGEDNFKVSLKIGEDARNCGNVSDVMMSGKFRRFNVPPTLLVGGSNDRFVPASEVQKICDYAIELGYRVWYKEIESMDHCLMLNGQPASKEIADIAVNFFEGLYQGNLPVQRISA